MSEKKKMGLASLKEKAADRMASIDEADMKEKEQKAGEAISGKAM